jgi:CHASE2 domain-containing sensor protein
MTRIVMLKLDGNLQEQGFYVTLEIRSIQNQIEVEEHGWLPANSALVEALQNWQKRYRDVGAPTRMKLKRLITIRQRNASSQKYRQRTSTRIKPKRIVVNGDKERIEACKAAADQFKDLFIHWLKSDSFNALNERLREELHLDEEVRFLLRSSDLHLKKLPWHEWGFVKRYEKTEISFTSQRQGKKAPILAPNSSRTRVLAILGHREGIDVEKDRQFLEDLPNSDITFLVEPLRQELSDRLWAQSWDVIFFAGHSETEGETGRIYLNPTDSLTLQELWYALRQAVKHGLKLAIFNSCDGLGLVQQLDDLAIPHVIVMRELVPDRVAHAFLKYLLIGLAVGKPVHLAVRAAREQLQALENEFPCATWLPVVHQNVDSVTVPPPATGLVEQTMQPLSPVVHPNVDSVPIPLPATSPSFRRKHVLLLPLLVALLVMGVRWMGWLQSAELQAYDHLMRSRPAEPIDARLVVVELTEQELNQTSGYPLHDDQLAALIQKVAEANPALIGVAMHRYQPRGQGRESLIKQLQTPNVITICAYDSAANDHAPPPEFTQQQKEQQMGFSDLFPDSLSTGLVIRRQLLSYDPRQAEEALSCITPYSFSIQIARKYFATQNSSFNLNQQTQEWTGDRVTLSKLRLRTGGYQRYEGIDGLSNQVLIHYRANQKPARRLTMNQVLRGDESHTLANRVVLIGYSDAPVAREESPTPIGELSGVWIHAHVISQILSSELDGRPLIWFLPQWRDVQWGDGLFVAFWALLGGTIVWMVRSPFQLFSLTGIGLFLLYQLSLAVLIQGGWVPLIPAAIAFLLSSSWSAYQRHHQQNPRSPVQYESHASTSHLGSSR